MTRINTREAKILRAVIAAKRPNFCEIARIYGSRNRLLGDLTELIQKGCLHYEREGREHLYTIKNPGVQRLAEYEAQIAGESLGSLAKIKEAEPEINLDLALKILQNAPLVMKALKMMEERNLRAH